MKIPHLALALSALCSVLGLQADTPQNVLEVQIKGITLEEILQLAQELSVPFKDGFQLEDLITVASILDTHFNKNIKMSNSDKQNALESVLNKIIEKQNFSAPEKSFLEKFTPALAFILFPDSADDSLTPPTNPSPSEQEVLSATDSFINKLNGSLSWQNIPSCVLFTCQFATSYSGLSSAEKDYLAKRLLGQIIDKTDTPYLPDAIFDEVFKRIGYPLIDYLVTKP